MECECCGDYASAIVSVHAHRRHVMCHKCLNEIDSSLDATSWYAQEWCDWRAAEAKATPPAPDSAFPETHRRVYAMRTKLYNYWKAAFDGRRAAIAAILDERKRAVEAAAGQAGPAS